jgi:cell wall-associated NlpC family hydrolase
MNVRYDHLVGRPFKAGTSDFLSLVREFYQDNFGIAVADYARPVGWSADELDLVRLFYEREGFQMITDWKPKELRPGDALCMAVGSSNPNHIAIYVGDNMMVHHLAGRMSSADPYRDFWRNSVCFVLRHPGVPDLTPVYPDVTIEELLRARFNLEAQED